MRLLSSLSVLLLLVLLAACAPRPAVVWDGRRGYDGNGDYGYDLAASRAEARLYRARAARAYAMPGPPEDPWGPHVREAAGRFGLPEHWIHAVMRQESGGRLYDAEGRPITSRAGAMGLMQVMPRTYDTLAARHGLGPDPYEPRDNILAGAAYLRAMHDRFGAPLFLAAYNAGPERVEAYLAGSTVLPDETMNYLAALAPRIGAGRAWAAAPRPVEAVDLAYAGGGMHGSDYAGLAPSDRAYAGGGLRGSDYAGVAEADRAYAGGGLRGSDYVGGGAALDPALRAFEGGGLVTRDAPTGILTPRR